MKQKHTPEPWRLYRNDKMEAKYGFSDTYLEGDGELREHIACLPHAGGVDDIARANAARIVACVNGCAGIENPEAIQVAVKALWELVACVDRKAIPADTAAIVDNALAALRGE